MSTRRRSSATYHGDEEGWCVKILILLLLVILDLAVNELLTPSHVIFMDCRMMLLDL
jgi:hypothetical protein